MLLPTCIGTHGWGLKGNSKECVGVINWVFPNPCEPWHMYLQHDVASLGRQVTKRQQLENIFLQICQWWDKVHVPIRTSSLWQTFKESPAKGGLSSYLFCQTFESPLISVCCCYFSDACNCHFWFLVMHALCCGCLLNLPLLWSTGSQIGWGKKKTKKKTCWPCLQI